jgi:tetratricopeptide (TPR) repeat protein
MAKLGHTISLCIIVRDEEEHIGHCLASVKEFVDEIIVVDTGCKDRTLLIAQDFGAQIFHHPWAGDFSQARNHSLAHANADWILVLDADEKLAKRDARHLRTLVQNDQVKGFRLIQRTYLWSASFVCSIPNPGGYEEGQGYSDCVDVHVIRLFRNDVQIRYQGRVHELVDPVFDSQKLPFLHSQIVVHHFGKVGNPEKLERKKQLCLELGRQKALEDAENPMAQFEMGVQLYELKEFQCCVPYFKNAYRLNQTFSLSLLYLAKAYHLRGDMEQANHYYRKCLELGSDNDRVLFDYANFERDQGHLKTALKLYQEVLCLNPRHALAVFNMGGVYIRLGKLEQGFDTLKRAIHLNPNNETFYENFGRLSLQGCYLDEAVKYLEDYVNRFPDTCRCQGLLAEIHFKLRRFELAKHWATRALEREPSKIHIRLVKANAEFSMGKLPEAEESYDAVLELDKENVDSMMNLALIAEHRNDTNRAELRYRQLLDRFPGHPVALKRYGALLASKDAESKTLTTLEQAYKVNQEDLECLLLLGHVYEKRKMWPEAIQLYEQAQCRNAKLARLAAEKIRRLQTLTHEVVQTS